MKTKVILGSLLLAACSEPARQGFGTGLDMGIPTPPADLAGFIGEPADLAVPAVSIASIAPARASTVGRELVTITGTGFDNTTQFSFGGIVAEISSVTATTAKVYTPANPGSWGTAVAVTARRARDGQVASNSNATSSPSAFRYYAATLAFTDLVGRLNPANWYSIRVPMVGDLNKDGLPDLIVAAYGQPYHSTLLNSGGGNFVNARNDYNYAAGATTSQGVLADLDGDGNLDMIIADESGTWQYDLGDGAGTMIARGQNYYQVCSQETSPVAIKLSNAMYPDVAIVCTNYNQVRIWNNQFNGGNQGSIFGGTNSGNQVTLSLSSSPQHLMVTDLNKDGKQDLVVVTNGNGGSTLTYYLNQGNFLPVNGSGSAGFNNNNQNPYWGKCGDLNGDGYPDCVVSDLNTSTVRIFLNDGTGALQAPKSVGGTINVGQEPREVNLADMNGDGVLDLLVASRQLANFQVIPGKGDGTFGNQMSSDNRILAAQTTVGNAGCRYGWSIQVADFDGDGRPDAVASCEQNDRGEGQFGGAYVFKNTSR